MSSPSCFLSTLRRGLLAAAVMSAPTMVFAQAMQDECRTSPPSNGAQPKAGSEALTEKLDACNGVLTPPATGDGGLVEPPPQTGTTPVIKPGALPPGGNPSNGAG